MTTITKTDRDVLCWIAKRGRPSYASAECRWGHYLDGVVDDGLVAVDWVGERKSGVRLTEAGEAALAPKRRLSDKDAANMGGE